MILFYSLPLRVDKHPTKKLAAIKRYPPKIRNTTEALTGLTSLKLAKAWQMKFTKRTKPSL